MARLLYFPKTVLTILILLALSIIFMLQPIKAKESKSREIGIVTTKRLNVRPEPGIKKPPLKVIERGTKVEVLEHFKGWLKIKHGGQVGYIRNLKQYVRTISVTTPSDKQTGDSDRDIKLFRQEAENISRKIKKGKAEILTFTRKEASIVNSLNDIDLALNEARKQTSAIKSELASLEKRIDETIQLSTDLKKKIKTRPPAGDGARQRPQVKKVKPEKAKSLTLNKKTAPLAVKSSAPAKPVLKNLPKPETEEQFALEGEEKTFSRPYFEEGGKVRKNALQVRREAEEAEKEILEQEKIWEIPAILRRNRAMGLMKYYTKPEILAGLPYQGKRLIG